MSGGPDIGNQRLERDQTYVCNILIQKCLYLIFSLFVLFKMLNNVINWDIKLPMSYVHGQELCCDIMNLSRYFTYLVMYRLFQVNYVLCTYMYGQELSCDIINFSRYFTYLVMYRPFSSKLCPSLRSRHNQPEKVLDIT